jgi:hypothetical protein
MITECINCYAPNFRIFTAEIILGNERLNFVAHGLIQSHLSRDCRPARGFRTASSFQNGATIPRGNAAQLRRALTFSQRPAKPSFQSLYRSGLFACDECSLTTDVAS